MTMSYYLSYIKIVWKLTRQNNQQVIIAVFQLIYNSINKMFIIITSQNQN